MTKKKSALQALFLSVLSLFVCVSLLIGTTFAWFTDSVVSKNNIIASGNLDVELEYSYDGSTWNKVLENTSVFSENELWEPGHTQYAYLRVSNQGTLALKYKLNANVFSETPGTNVANESFNISEHLLYGVIPEEELGTSLASREAAVAKAVNELEKSMDISGGLQDLGGGWDQLVGAAISERSLLPNESNVTALIITMPTSVGNEANYKKGSDIPKISFGIELYATQLTHEEDSYGKDYDDDSEYAELTFDLQELKDGLQNGEDVILGDNMEILVEIPAPYGNKAGLVQNGGTFDGNGKTITFDCYGDDYGIMTYGGTIKNVTIENVARGIVTMSPSEDIILENVKVSNDVLYPFNTTEHAPVPGVDIFATKCSFGGWTSFAGVETATFESCNFIYGNYGYGWPYDCLVKPFVNTLFKNCDFAEDYYIDLSSLDSNAVVTFENCTVNGTVVTASNYASLFGELELHSGITVADNVVFK